MKTEVRVDTYWDDETRRVEQMVSFGASYTGKVGIAWSYGWTYSSCAQPPTIIDQCG